MPENDIIEQIPPQNIEAEQSLLGCLLIDKDSIIKVADILGKDDFYKDAHNIIYGTIKELYSKHEPIDILTLSNRLEENNKLESIGGRSYLAHLSSMVATPAHIENYANIVQKKATLRRLLETANEIAKLGFREGEDVDDLLDKAEQKLFSVSQKYLKNSFIPVDKLLTDAFDRIDDLHKQSGKLRGTPSGFIDLDKLLSGFQKSDLIILAARPSVGKTTFALDIIRQCAVKSKTPVGIFSLEMSKEQLVDRLLCAQANVSLWKMRTGSLSDRDEDNDFIRIGESMGILSEAPIFIDDSPNSSIMEIRAKARRLQIEKNLGLLVVDYLQLMEGRGKYSENRVQEVAEITRGLKGIARELDIPVIALSQLSRAVEQIKPAIPKLANLRDSGSIEQDADIVMFLHRKDVKKVGSSEEDDKIPFKDIDLIVAKNRNGPIARVKLLFHKNCTKFVSLQPHMV